MCHLQDIEAEEPNLVDPCFHRPREHFTFVLDGTAVPVDDNAKGAATIEILHLNRKDLRRERGDRIKEVLGLIESLRNSLSDPTDAMKQLAKVYFKPTSRYSAACRAIWRNPRAFGLPEEFSGPRTSL